MKIKKIILSLGVISLVALPFISTSCGRYSVTIHNEVQDAIKKYVAKDKHLEEALPNEKIKIASQSKSVNVGYVYNYLAGNVDWSAKIGDKNYSDTVWGWLQYPNLTLLPISDKAWGSAADIDDVENRLEFDVIGNSYTPYQYIDITDLIPKPKIDVAKKIKQILLNIANNTMVNYWGSNSTEQNKSIDEAISAYTGGTISKKHIDDSIKGEDIDDISGILKVVLDHKPQLTSNFINYGQLPANIKDPTTAISYDMQIKFFLNWAQQDKNKLTDMFSSFEFFKYSDFIDVINSLNTT